MIYPGKKKASMVQITGDRGSVQTEMQGNERIYSQEDTKKIITLARNSKSKKDLIKLGEFICQATKRQDKKKPEYVS
jgi:hypothetical protein